MLSKKSRRILSTGCKGFPLAMTSPIKGVRIRDNPETKKREALDSLGNVFAVIDKEVLDHLNTFKKPEELRAFAAEKQMPFPLTPWGSFAMVKFSLDAQREREKLLPQNNVKEFNGVADDGTIWLPPGSRKH